jgi:predicted nucleic acid-binding protein
MSGKIFIDTNIFVYTQSSVEMKKRNISTEIIENNNCHTSTQVLSEVSNVLTKKLNMPIREVKQIISAVNANCTINIVDYDTVQNALDLKERYAYSYYDSLILAAAIESGCSKIFSEDMSNRQIIENTLEILNPFK